MAAGYEQDMVQIRNAVPPDELLSLADAANDGRKVFAAHFAR